MRPAIIPQCAAEGDGLKRRSAFHEDGRSRVASAEALFERRFVRRFSSIERQARRKLEMLEAAKTLGELRSPPGNRLEALAGDRQGQHSIRINDQWRIFFVWRQDGAYHVEIVDYH